MSELSARMILWKLQQAYSERAFRKNGLVETSTTKLRGAFRKNDLAYPPMTKQSTVEA